VSDQVQTQTRNEDVDCRQNKQTKIDTDYSMHTKLSKDVGADTKVIQIELIFTYEKKP